MNTECTQGQLPFQPHFGREIVARFDGGDISSDGGLLLLREVNDRVDLLSRFAGCFEDFRDENRIEHTVEELISQRTLGLACGYEDLNDHDDLRHDPLFGLVAGKRDLKGEKRERRRDRGKALAGRSTLNRLELTPADADASSRYKKVRLDPGKVDALMVDLFLEAHEKAPEEIVLDLDATDDPLHGKQEGRFFHGYYNCYCYLPLYIFCGEHLLCARIRPADRDGAFGSIEELTPIVSRIRQAWPSTRIIIRGDSGFCRDWLMNWCEENNIHYVLGLARNGRLERKTQRFMDRAKAMNAKSGKAERVFANLLYTTKDSWSHLRRVVAKAEHLGTKSNPRFIVTSFSIEQFEKRALYEDFYCARGDMENRIKEQQLYLFADRTSAATIRANQVRLYFSSMAYCLLQALRRLALDDTELAHAQCHTIREKLIKVGAQIRITTRRVWISFAENWPYRRIFAKALQALGPPGCTI